MPVSYTIKGQTIESISVLAKEFDLEADVILEHQCGRDGVDLNYRTRFPPYSIPAANYHYPNDTFTVPDYPGLPKKAKQKVDEMLLRLGEPSPEWAYLI